MKACSKCGIALTPAHGGPGRRVMVCWDSGATSPVELCRPCYASAVEAILRAIMDEKAKAAGAA